MNAEFWSAIVGAVVGSASAGLITWFLQDRQDKRQAKSKDQSLARSLLFKLIRIYCDFEGLRRHVEECRKVSAKENVELGWQFLRPIGNLPDKISFTSDEMSYLLSLKDFRLFDKVLTLDTAHSSTIEILRLYKQRRLAVTDLLPAAMEGTIGTASLKGPEKALLDPKFAELDQLASAISERVTRDANESRQALIDTNSATEATIGSKLKIEFVAEGENEIRVGA